ncbi:MAG: 16S rRNA processing protein RimM [Clostridiales bacterium]|nr:16S rRNA processing protein RimM [Clostridiales bacterium]
MELLKYLSVGYVLKPHGVRGALKVEPLTDNMYRFDYLDQVFLKKGNNQYRPVKIEDRKYGKNFVILKLEGYEDRNQSETLRGEYLWVPRENAVALPEDTYYIADIIGCSVETSNGQLLGHIVRVLKTGSNDVYIVRDKSKNEILIPALKKVVNKINLVDRKIIVKAEEMEGLLTDED